MPFFLLFQGKWELVVCLATAEADCYIVNLRPEICG